MGGPDAQDAEALLVCKIQCFDTVGFGDFTDGIGIEPGIDAQAGDRFPDFYYFGCLGQGFRHGRVI